MKIGLISDTHGSIADGAVNFLKDCDEIWHAGDIGNVELADRLSGLKTFRAVYGNIDGGVLRQMFPEVQLFDVSGLKVLMIHEGGYPGRYQSRAAKLIKEHKPGLFISGHSHILKVMYDKTNMLLHVNPGSVGNSGFHHVKTAVRFAVSAGHISDMEIWEQAR